MRTRKTTRAICNAAALLLLPPALCASSIILDLSEVAEETQFTSAVNSADLVFLGRESFPSLGEGVTGTTPSPLLAPGVSAGSLFPTGSNATLGLYFQTNALGGNPNALSPGGNLYATGPVPGLTPAWLGPNLASNSLDIIIDPPAHRGQVHALSLALATTGGSPVVIRLYDNENNLQGSETLAISDPVRIGILLSDEPLFRVNLWASSGFLDVGELDLYAIPEPAAGAFLLATFAALAALAAKNRHREIS